MKNLQNVQFYNKNLEIIKYNSNNYSEMYENELLNFEIECYIC